MPEIFDKSIEVSFDFFFRCRSSSAASHGRFEFCFDSRVTLQETGDESFVRIRKCASLRANDDETTTCREFTLEGQGRSIQWLCPF